MFLTNRETLLLTELMNSTGPVSLDRMMQVLKVSKRTVYRELANLEKSLETVGATLEKVGRGHFQILHQKRAFANCKKPLWQIPIKNSRLVSDNIVFCCN